MFTRSGVISAIVMTAVCGVTAAAKAADPPDLFLQHLADFGWKSSLTGTQPWRTADSWNPPAGFAGQFPDDPGRNDMAEQVIDPVEGANFSTALGSDLTVDIAGGDVTVASIKLGGTGAARTTDILSSTNHLLVFENQESNDNLTNPGNPSAMPPIEPEPIWSFNQGVALIWSTGTAGAGKENRISANIKFNDQVDVEGDRDLHIYGDLIEGDRMTVTGEAFRPAALTNLMSGGATLYVHGDVVSSVFDEDAAMTGTQDRTFQLNFSRGLVLPVNPQFPTPTEDEVSRQGRVDMTGQFIGDGWVEIGSPQGNTLPLGTFILLGDSRDDPNVPNIMRPDPQNPEGPQIVDPYNPADPFFNGRLLISRGNLVLDHDGALGSGDFKTSNPNQGFGFNFISTSDDRNISTDNQIAQWQTVRGASGIAGLESIGDHSIEFSGAIEQDNTRGWVNLLPSGKTLTISGPQYPLQGLDNSDPERIYTVDGSGTTLITGGILNRHPSGTNPGVGHFRVRGTGGVYVDWDGVQGMIPDPDNPGEMILDPEDRASDFGGYTWMEGGNLHFAQNEDLGEGAILSRGGAVGVDAGVVGNSTFLAKLNNSSLPNWPPLTSPFFLVFNTNSSIFTTFSSGGLMLADSEYTQNLDFTTGDLANAANMTLAAREGGSSYTGTISPSSTIPVNPNTYQLGGGGVLTLPNNNQLTGARGLLATNGGEVRLQGTNNYTGTTRITGKYLPSVQLAATGNQPGADVETADGSTDTYRRTTLTVSSLANGGSSSSIGSSSNAASNLVIQGSALKYVGGGTSTDRLFTVGTAGATIDSSGSGAISFTNTAALGIDTAENRPGFLAVGAAGNGNNEIFGRPTEGVPFSAEDLVQGIRIRSVSGTSSGWIEDLDITGVPSVDAITVGLDTDDDDAVWGGFTATGLRTIDFGPAPARMLTLSGSNSGDNTLASLVGDASDIGEANAGEVEDGYGTVGIRKTGVGKWILTNNNTYGGATDVEEGTLVINGVHTSKATTTVSADGTLGGTGSLGGPLVNAGTVAPGASAGNLTVTGNYDQYDGAKLAIEIGGSGAGQFDKLQVLAGVAAPSQPGDYNLDGFVNTADYSIWRDTLGSTTDLRANGDNTGDSMDVIDQADYDYWNARFGNGYEVLGIASMGGAIDIDLINGFTPAVGNMFTILTAQGVNVGQLTLSGESSGFNLIVNPTSLVLHYTGAGSGGLASNAAVPEPTGLGLAGLAVLGLGVWRRRR